MKRIHRIGLALSLAWAGVLATGCSSSGEDSVDPPGGGGGGEELTEEVTLQRDTFGVPHVYAESDAGAFFGLGYAMAEDRLFQMHWMRLIARGRAAEFFGAGEDEGFLAHDRELRLSGLARVAEASAAALPAKDRALLEAFARGVNHYAESPDAVLHPFFTQFGVPVEPWTAADAVLLHLLNATRLTMSAFTDVDGWLAFQQAVQEFGEQAAIDLFTDPGEIDEPAAVVQEHDVSEEWKQAVQDFADGLGLEASAPAGPRFHYAKVEAPKFSHAWAVGGSRSTTGSALFHGDPRMNIFVPSYLYEWHVAGATFDARGVGVVGSPNMLIGNTEQVAWSITSAGADLADLFLLETDEANHPGQYLLDGEWVDFENERTETLVVKGGPDETLTYRESHFGPDVTAAVEVGLPDRAFALKSLFLDLDHPASFPGFLAMMRAQDAEEFGAALEGWSTPASNVLFADRHGSIGYWLKGPLPLRSPLAPLGGAIVQEGTSIEHDWLALVPHELLPHVIDPQDGWIFSANHAPVGSWYAIPLSLSSGSKGDNPRSRRLRELLTAQPIFTPEEFTAIHDDTVNVSRRDVAAIGIALRDQLPPGVDGAALQDAFAELKPWLDLGAPMTAEHHGAVLASFIDPLFRDDPEEEGDPGETLVAQYGGGENGLQTFLKEMLGKVESGAAFDEDEALWILGRVQEGWEGIVAEVGPDPADWQQWFVEEELHWEFETWTTLSPVPSLTPDATVLAGPFSCTDGGTVLSAVGQAFSFRAVFGDSASNRSLLPMGQSEHAGPHEFDQQGLLVSDGAKPAPIQEADVEAAGTLSEVVLEFEP